MDDDTRYEVQAVLDELWTAAVERERDCPHEHAQARAQAQIRETTRALGRIGEIVTGRLRDVLYNAARMRDVSDDSRYEPALEDVADLMGVERFAL